MSDFWNVQDAADVERAISDFISEGNPILGPASDDERGDASNADQIGPQLFGPDLSQFIPNCPPWPFEEESFA